MDLIERQDALDTLEKIGWIETKSDKEYAIQLFTDLPSAQPEIEERKEESAQNVPKEDLISRKAAIDAIGKTSDELYENIKKGATFPQRQWFDGMAQAQSILENLPSAQPEPNWIPISERLPKLDETVLVTTEWNDLSIAWRTGIDKWYIHEGNTNSTTDDLTAWMPLPKPYKAESEEI